ISLTTTSVTVRFSPFWVSYWRCVNLPSTATSLPLSTYFSLFSAFLPHATILCHWVSCFFSPSLVLKNSLVASEKRVTFLPLSRVVVAGASPTFPISWVLFLIVLMIKKIKG